MKMEEKMKKLMVAENRKLKSYGERTKENGSGGGKTSKYKAWPVVVKCLWL